MELIGGNIMETIKSKFLVETVDYHIEDYTFYNDIKFFEDFESAKNFYENEIKRKFEELKFEEYTEKEVKTDSKIVTYLLSNCQKVNISFYIIP